MKTVIFSDRDGTINRDADYFLGSEPGWKEKIHFLDGVVEGIRLINSIKGSYFFILTNQPGVALKGRRFDSLTLERMHEVNEHIIKELREFGLRVDGYFASPFVSREYAEKMRRRGIEINEEYIKDDNPDRKPNIGMAEKALRSICLNIKDCRIYTIGDRASDVELGINAGGTGILVESDKTRELDDRKKVEEMQGRKYIARNFLDAARFIASNEV